LAEAALRMEADHDHIEYCVLVDRDLNVVVSTGTPGLTFGSGDKFDPHGIGSLALETGLYYRVAGEMYFENLLAHGVQKYQDGDHHSNLHPFDTKETSLVRYTATPVYASEEDEKNHINAIGAIVSGAIVNGKTILCDLLLEILHYGYCGIYFYTDEEFILTTSILKKDKDDEHHEDLVDIPLDSDAILHRTMKNHVDDTDPESGYEKINSKSYAVAVKRIPADTARDEHGMKELPHKVDAFVVFARPEKASQESVTLWLGVSVHILGALLSAAAMILFARIAFKPMKKILKDANITKTRSHAHGPRGKWSAISFTRSMFSAVRPLNPSSGHSSSQFASLSELLMRRSISDRTQSTAADSFSIYSFLDEHRSPPDPD